MPRMIAPQPSDEFSIRLSKPLSGPSTQLIEVTGSPNRSSSVKSSQHGGSNTMIEKVGDVPKDDVPELMALLTTLRGFPSDPEKDIYGLDTRLEFATFEIQWSNDDEDPSPMSEVTPETKQQFKDVVDSIEALARQFAKRNSAI